MEPVQRYDFATIAGKPTRTPQGYLKIDANLTRTGVLLYRNADGSVRRELRLPDEVFNGDSMQSLGLAPVTDLHPPEGLVNLDNTQELRRGTVSENVGNDGKFLQAQVVIDSKELIKKIEKGDRRELSPGYTCNLDETPGEWNGERYDAIQRNIVYNHLAVGPKGWGRSGSEVSLKMDSGLVSYESKATTTPEGAGGNAIANKPAPSDAVGAFVRAKLEGMDKSTGHMAEKLGVDVWAVDAFLDGSWAAIEDNKAFLDDPDQPRPPMTGIAHKRQFTPVADFIGVDVDTLFELVPVAERGDGGREPRQQRNDAMTTKTIRLDNGTSFQVPAEIAETVEAGIAQLKADGDKARADATELQTKVDGLQGQLDAEKARADAAEAKSTELQAKLDEGASPEKISELVQARADLEATAHRVIGKVDGKDVDFKGKTDREVKLAVIKHADSGFDVDGDKAKNDSYVEARFDSTVAHIREDGARVQHNNDTYAAAAGAQKEVAKIDDGSAAEQARLDAQKRGQEAWKQPLGGKQAQAQS